MLVSFQVAVAFSDWFSLFLGMPEVLGSASNWPLAFAFPGIPALGLCCLLPFCPESPKFTLVFRGNRDQALADLRRLFSREEARAMFETLVKETALSNKVSLFALEKLKKKFSKKFIFRTKRNIQ
jgi:hypothetical protein